MTSLIVKWVGGKTRLLPELHARLPGKFGRYFEPFLGGGALFFSLAPEDAILGDMNGALIGMYEAVSKDPDSVIAGLKTLRENYRCEGTDYYYVVRDWWNKGMFLDPPTRASVFLFLNKTCFNGLWRVNRRGEFNVPAGRYSNPEIFDPEELRVAGGVLKRASLNFGSYTETTKLAALGDFVYFDPPYYPTTDTSFTTYTKDSFGVVEQQQLADHARLLRSRGAYVMLSNSDTPFIRELYRDFCVDTVQCGRAINSKASGRGKVNEVIITSYPRRDYFQTLAR